MTISLLNKFIKNQAWLYDILQKQKGFLHTDSKSKDVTDKYLFWVLRQEIFTIMREKCSVPPKLSRRATVVDLIEILTSLTQLPLGFDCLTPPNKEWLIQAIYHLKPTHEIFQSAKSLEMRALPKKLNILFIYYCHFFLLLIVFKFHRRFWLWNDSCKGAKVFLANTGRTKSYQKEETWASWAR